MKHAEVVRAFGFEIDADLPLKSIYSYAPVFRLSTPDGTWIVKRSQKPLARGLAIANWSRLLAARGIRVVTPACGFGDNPRSFQDENGEEDVWVVYPFIEGHAYSGDTTQIRAAGDLLGKIHAAGAQKDMGLKVCETVVAVDSIEIEEDTEGIMHLVCRAFPKFADATARIVKERTQRYLRQALPRLLAVNLPLTNGSWDYKASNLVYKANSVPVLVDVDSGGRIPRAYDLAIAALLFHNEGVGPGRLFTEAEWMTFLEGYGQHVQLGDMERSHWDDILLCAWMDEALWLLRNDEAGWMDPNQSRMLLSLLITSLSAFALSR